MNTYTHHVILYPLISIHAAPLSSRDFSKMASTTLGELFEEAEALVAGAPDKATEKFMTIGILRLARCIVSV